MFKNTFQSGFLSILYSIGSKPLQIWDKQVRNGHIKRITDQDIQSSVLEIMGTNVSTNHITCPADKNKTLGIKLPFLVMIIKNVSACSHALHCPTPAACSIRCRVSLSGDFYLTVIHFQRNFAWVCLGEDEAPNAGSGITINPTKACPVIR